MGKSNVEILHLAVAVVTAREVSRDVPDDGIFLHGDECDARFERLIRMVSALQKRRHPAIGGAR
jgi:hypothetical protein